MSTTFPTSIQDLDPSRGQSGNPLSSPNHITHHQTEDDTIEALQAKVGADGSAVTTSHDYKLSEVTSTDKAVGKTATQTLTNKTLTSPTITTPKITVGSDAVGDLHYTSNVDGTQSRLAKGNDNQILKMNGSNLNWEDETVNSNASTTVKGIVELATSSEITAGTATGGTGAALVVTPDALAGSAPTFSAANLTNIISFTSGTASKDSGDASVVQNIAHGLGKTPKRVKLTFFAQNSTTSAPSGNAFLSYNGTTSSCVGWQYVTSSGAIFNMNSSGNIVLYMTVGTNYNTGVVTFDGTNIIITWTRTGSGTGLLFDILWEAEG